MHEIDEKCVKIFNLRGWDHIQKGGFRYIIILKRELNK
jgi:hypothetical protein